MKAIQLNLCLVVLALWMPYFVSGADNHQTSFHDEDEVLPSSQSLEPHDVPMLQKSSSNPNQSDGRVPRHSYTPNNKRNVGGNMGRQFTGGLFPAPGIGQPLDAQASSASKNVVYALNNKNTFSDFAKPAEETLKRLTRNPDAMDDIVGQFQELGGGMTKNLLQQVSQSAPDMSKSFGQALNEALTQTNMLAQAAPGSFNLSQLTQSLRQPNLTGGLDLGQLGQTLSQNFFAGATQNLLGKAQPGSGADAVAAAPTGTDTVGSAAPDAESEGTPEQNIDAEEQIVGQPLLPGLRPFGKLPPLGQFCPMSILGQIAHLMALGSEISEVRVLPDQNAPFKVSPKEVDHQTMAEMKLRAFLKDALTRKTIPILWFHVPKKNKEQKTKEELEMEEKLENFEQQVIAELKQLQELAKMANEIKKGQLESGFQTTPSLTTKLDLFEIPIYDITLADIEKTLKDEHVIMLMQTLAQNKKNSQQHQQATTKYVTDLTGTPIKRQTTTTPDEETLKSMGKEDMLKMMAYAYRMAALNGHDMPWVQRKMPSADKTDSTKSTITNQQIQNMQIDGERKWLAEKDRRMGMEGKRMMATPQIQQTQPLQRQMMPMSDMHMPTQQQQQQQQHNERQMMPEPIMHVPQQMPTPQSQLPQRQMAPMTDMHMPMQQNERQMMPEPMMSNFDMPQQMPREQPQLLQRQMMHTSEAHMPMQHQQQRQMMHQPMMNNLDMSQQMALERQQQQTMPQMQPVGPNNMQQPHGHRTAPTAMPLDPYPEQLSEPKIEMNTKQMPESMPPMSKPMPPMDEAENKARFKGLDFFNDNMFGGKSQYPSRPAAISYYYSPAGSRYPSHNKHGYHVGYGGGSYANQFSSPSPHHHHHHHYPYSAGPNHYSYGYRTAVGDAEIAQMLKEEQSQPKLMLKMRTPNNEEPTTTNRTENTNEKTPNEEPNKSSFKRLARKQNESFSDNVAAYVVVLRNNDNRSSKSSRLRRKRSTEYATLEPIDESSLEALRKTYKNSLKEITLNPNETPAEALMRYNAESIREALEKANKQPMEIEAGEPVEEVKGAGANVEVEQVQRQEQISKTLPQTYTVSQLLPVTTSSETIVANGPYVTQPLTVSFSPQQAGAYDSVGLPGENYNNIIAKYDSPGVYSTSNKYVAQNPYLHVHSPLESDPYIDNNSVDKQAGTGKATKTLVYQSPQLGFNHYLSHHLPDYEVPSANTHHAARHLSNLNTYTDAFSPPRQAQVQSIQSFRTQRPQDSVFLDNIISLVKQQLVECCHKCKNDILQSLEETLKRQHHGQTFADKSHRLTYRKLNRDEDFEHKQWLAEMSKKGYNKNHLTKQHQQDYLKDGKLNLYVAGEPDFRYKAQNVFFKNNQSFKRETLSTDTESEADRETEIVTAAMADESKTEKHEQEEEDEDEGPSESQVTKASADKKSTTKTEKETVLELVHNKNDTIDLNDPSSSERPATMDTNKSIELAESTTHSMYTLRGQFRPSKTKPAAFSLKQGKQFANYKNINKLGNANSIAMANDKENTDEKIEEILDVLQDLNKDIFEVNFSTATSSAATTTPKPPSTTPPHLIWRTVNSTERVEKSTSEKLSRKKSKSRKTSLKPENAQ